MVQQGNIKITSNSIKNAVESDAKYFIDEKSQFCQHFNSFP